MRNILPKSYIEQVYGSYDAIADKLVELDNQIAALQKELEKADVNSIEELTKELNEYKSSLRRACKNIKKNMYLIITRLVMAILALLRTIPQGKPKRCNIINGNPTSYVITGKTDSDGNTIYKVL